MYVFASLKNELLNIADLNSNKSLPWFLSSKWQILFILVLTLILRIIYLSSQAGHAIDSDEAVFGLMAMKIAAFKEFPIYCWEAQYAGAPVSYIAALIFKLFGAGPVCLRLAMLPFTLMGVFFFHIIYKKIFGNFLGFLATLYLIFCPYLFLTYSMAALGGYGETFCGSSLIIIMSWYIRKNYTSFSPSTLSLWFIFLGFICGFFNYILFLIIPAIFAFAFPLFFFIKKNRKKNIIVFIIGGLIGSIPMIVYNIFTKGGTILRSVSRGASVGRESLDMSFYEIISNIIIKKISYLYSWITEAPYLFAEYISPFKIHSNISYLLGLAYIFVLLYFLIKFIQGIKKNINNVNFFYFTQFALFLIFLILFEWCANLSRARHLLPVVIIFPVAFFYIVQIHQSWRKVCIFLFFFICILQVIGWGYKSETLPFSPNKTATIMEKKGIREFYGSYNTTYPIMFTSKGRLKGSPYLLNKCDIISDRRPDYTKQINKSPLAAFVFSDSQSKIRNQFLNFVKKNKVHMDSIKSDEAIIYYNLSYHVVPKLKSLNEITFSIIPLIGKN